MDEAADKITFQKLLDEGGEKEKDVLHLTRKFSKKR